MQTTLVMSDAVDAYAPRLVSCEQGIRNREVFEIPEIHLPIHNKKLGHL